MHDGKDDDEERILQEAAHAKVRLLLLVLLRNGRAIVNRRQMGLYH